MQVVLKQVQGISFAGKGDSGHWLPIDGPEEFGGSAAASRPMELILMGLGGCTSMDVISILKKKRVQVQDYECIIDAERAPRHPKVFTKIHMKYVFYGRNIAAKDVERAIQHSEESYCSVIAMLKKSVDITTEYEIIDS
jgi:putative redox protein